MIISTTFPIKPFLCGLLTGVLLTGSFEVLTGSLDVLTGFLLTGLLGFAPGLYGRTFILGFGGAGGNWVSLPPGIIIWAFLFMAAVSAGIINHHGTTHNISNSQGVLSALGARLHHASNTVNTSAADMGNIIGKFPFISTVNPFLLRRFHASNQNADIPTQVPRKIEKGKAISQWFDNGL